MRNEKKIWDETEFVERIRMYRRDFHKYAEAKWAEFRTAAVVATRLRELGIETLLGDEISVKGYQFGYPGEEKIEAEIERAVAQGAERELVEKMNGLPGVVGIIDTGRPGPVVAFRFDIDALVTTESDDEGHFPRKEGFRSVNEGYCHACGHDGHTAIGLGVAEALMTEIDGLYGKVKLIFQPAEEGGGGARGIVARGMLDDVDYFFAAHVGLTKLDGLPLGSHGLICGVKDFLDSRRYTFRFIGKAAHPCGDPQVGKNALLAACSAALAIHGIAPHSEGMTRVNVGVLNAGTVRNAIAARASMEVEMRGENDTVAEYAERKALTAVRGAAMMYENELEIEHIGSTTSARSDDVAIALVQECAGSVGWFRDIHPVGSVGGSDDASEMLRQVQKNGGIGTYMGLGANFAASFHNSAFDFDEAVLMPGVALLVGIVEKLLLKK